MDTMRSDERDLIDVLRFELEFLEKGGYGLSPREPRRFQFMFEDSPTCMNYDSKTAPVPCSQCALMKLVPPEASKLEKPCRHIPLDDQGETLDSLYRYADQHEIDDVYRSWLKGTIAKLEQSRSTTGPVKEASNPAPVEVQPNSRIGADDVAKGEPLFHNFHPKCANPACATPFEWLAGGKFLRFRKVSNQIASSACELPNCESRVKHYWLCERCSNQFTLTYDEHQHVVVKLLWPELPAADAPKELPELLIGKREI